ncbi:MAG TPA: glycosyltransferase family 39 protein, partial [Vicinamibacterales bacterium]
MRFDPQHGLRVDYYANTTWTPPAQRTARDQDVSADRIRADWQALPPPAFSAIWSGWLWIPRGGTYTFPLDADGACALAIDGARVSECGSPPTPVDLTRGAHHLFLQYVHTQSSPRIDLAWARGSAAPSAIPAARLLMRKPRVDAPIVVEVLLPDALEMAEWAWIGWLVLFCGSGLALGTLRLDRRLRSTDYWRPLRWILVGSLVLNVLGIWWGLPGVWVPIELRPAYVIDGLAQHFSHGWTDVYPPMQFYLQALVLSPVLLLWHWGRIDFARTNTFVILLTRLLSIAQAAAIVAAVFAAAREVFGRRAGLFAAAIMALTATFLYYAKTANVDVPYVCWFAVSLVFYLRLLARGATRDFVLFGVFAALSVCTKDQAYGLYSLL